MFCPSAAEDGGGRSTGLVPRSSRSFTASSVRRSIFSSSNIDRSTLASTSLRDSAPLAVELVLVSVVSSLVEYRAGDPTCTRTTGSSADDNGGRSRLWHFLERGCGDTGPAQKAIAEGNTNVTTTTCSTVAEPTCRHLLGALFVTVSAASIVWHSYVVKNV